MHVDFNEIEELLQTNPQKAVDELLEKVKRYYGEIPYILEVMRSTPELLLQKIRYDTALAKEFKHIEPKIIELISIAVAAALRCTHCLKLHIRVAQRMGATKEEIFDTILLAASLSNAAVLAEGTRAINEEIQKTKKTPDCAPDDDACDVCELTKNND
jgi:AhpD family alkylhydroperoxidase